MSGDPNMYKVEAKPEEDSDATAVYHVVVMARSDEEAEKEVRKIYRDFKSVKSQGTIQYVSVSDYTLVPHAWG
jgi:hypothetical protein